MAELFTLNPLFPGKSEGLQIFEILMVLGKPDIKFWNKFPQLPLNIRDSFLSLEDFKPQDLNKILNKSKKYDKDFVKLASDLLSQLIKMDPEERIDAKTALKHKFFE